MMINLELTLAKFIIVALLIIIAVLVFVIIAQSRIISKILDDKMREKEQQE